MGFFKYFIHTIFRSEIYAHYDVNSDSKQISKLNNNLFDKI